MKEENNRIVIVAPHVDDECIGCFSILSDESKSISIVYSTRADVIRREEALSLKSKFNNVTSQFFSESIPPVFLNPKTTLYFPDPIFEVHPLHRMYGALGENLLRQGLDIIFYSVNMQAPYIFEVEHWMKKKEILDEVYPSQKDLWNNDSRYFFFEGYNKWLIKRSRS